MAIKTSEDIAQDVFDSTEELLDIAAWIRGFYLALKLVGFDNRFAAEITASWVNGTAGRWGEV